MGNKKTILFLGVAVLGLFLMNAVFGPINITRAANSPVTGYAWSDNIGWIQMNPTFGGVQIDSSTGEGIFSGYAWSDNIGWINFAPTSGFPETPSEGAKLNLSTGQITGWIKAVAADNNGWDGWIKMRGETGSVITCPSGYIYNSVTLKCEASPIYSCASGYTYNSSTGKCEQSPTCPTGGAYNSTNNRCEAGATTGCPSGYTYNSSTGKCEQSPPCSGPCAIGPDVYYDPISNKCVIGTPPIVVCTASPCSPGATLNGTTDKCEVGATYSCPSGYLLSGSVCIASAVCSSGGIFNGTTDKCELAPVTSCPLGGSFNSSTGKCEADPILGGGSGSSYGVDVNLATGVFSGYAWGSDVVGWVSFSGVTMNPSAPAVTLSALPNPIDYNTASTLTWTSSNVDSCTLDGGIFSNKSEPASSFESTGNLTSAKTYTITCTGPGGSAANSVTVDVNPFVPVCGDDICNGSETCSTCSQDCGVCVPAKDFNLNSSNAIFASLVGDAPSISTETTITVAPLNSFASNVALSVDAVDAVSPALSGATFNFTDSSLSSSEYSTGTKFSVSVPSGTSSGLYTITIRGDGGGLIRTVNVQLNIEAIEPSWIEI